MNIRKAAIVTLFAILALTSARIFGIDATEQRAPDDEPLSVAGVEPEVPQKVEAPPLTPAFTDEDVFQLMIFDEPLVPAGGSGESDAERQAFVAALTAYAASIEARQPGFEVLDGFVAAFPKSRWRAALEFNLGLARYQQGFFTRSMAHYEKAYDLAKADREPRAKALADRALAESASMNARGSAGWIRSMPWRGKQRRERLADAPSRSLKRCDLHWES